MRSLAIDALFGSILSRLRTGFEDQATTEMVVRNMHAAFQAQFMSQGAYGGAPWAPLAEATIRRKPGGSYMILVATDALRAALTQPGEGAEVTVTDGGAGLELSVEGFDYASYLQSGTRNMPARELVTEKMLEDAGEQIADELGDRIVEGEGGEGGEGGVLGEGEELGEELGEGLEGLGGLL